MSAYGEMGSFGDTLILDPGTLVHQRQEELLAVHHEHPSDFVKAIAVMAEEGLCRLLATYFYAGYCLEELWFEAADQLAGKAVKRWEYAARACNRVTRRHVRQFIQRCMQILVTQCQREWLTCVEHVRLKEQLGAHQQLRSTGLPVDALAPHGLFRAVSSLLLDEKLPYAQVTTALSDTLYAGYLNAQTAATLTVDDAPCDPAALRDISGKMSGIFLTQALRECAARIYFFSSD